MSTFRILIDTDNAAFDPLGPEVARILRELADTVEPYEDFAAGIQLCDYNGNVVGRAQTIGAAE